jgi:tRNA threonylcarbamoyl adenosine modification protein (Sua5/YciO/YrdC/YwlC family)
VFLTIDPQQPEPWLIARAAEVFRRGGVGVIPTDTVYGLACCISHPEAVQRLYALKDLDPKKPLAILVGDMPMIGRYAKGISNPVFRMMKRVLPGAYTFILNATPEVPKIMLRKRKTIGVRMPDNPIALDLLAQLDEPLITTSVRTPDDDFINDPGTIDQIYGSRVDLVLDGGALAPDPSTVVDLSEGEPVLVRSGKGDVDALEMFEL